MLLFLVIDFCLKRFHFCILLYMVFPSPTLQSKILQRKLVPSSAVGFLCAHTLSWSFFLYSIYSLEIRIDIIHCWGTSSCSLLLYLFTSLIIVWGASGSSDGKEPACMQCRRVGLNLWIGNIPWRREWQLTAVFLPGESHGQTSLAGYSPWGCKESDGTERLTLIMVILT